MKKGILILALGNENYYRMAYTLAASIRANEPALNIAVATDRPIDIRYSRLFKEQIIIEESVYLIKGKLEYIRAKLFAYDFSPFEETIFLDADQIIIPGRKVVPIFEELKNIELTFSNTGLANTSMWADIQEVKNVYGDAPFWNYHSEFFYFKKNSEVKKYFATAKAAYDKAKLKSVTPFAGGKMADELAFQIAAMQTGLYPHEENWTPNFWYDRDRNNSYKYPYQLLDFVSYSIGGNHVPTNVKDNYNTLAKFYFAKLGLSNPYQVVDKRKFLPERKLI